MSFPSMNAKSVAIRVSGATSTTTTGVMGALATGPHNLLSVPAPVDVSGMEWSFSVAADSITGANGMELSTADASRLQITLADGGPTGDATATAILAAVISNTVAFVDTVPRDVTGTSTTDLDADDWVNLQITAQPGTIAGAGIVHVNTNYIYGVPGAIN
jgi:hypothetical protein